MPRDHGRILTTIWQDADFQKLSTDAQRLYFLLLSQPDINNAGVLPMRLTKWARGCIHTDHTHLRFSLDELQQRRFVYYDDDTEEVLVRSYIRRDGVLKHPNLAKSALRFAESVESCALRRVLADELYRTRRNDAKAVADRLSDAVVGDGIGMASESHSDGIGMASAIGMASGWHRDACGVGVGEGVGVTLVTTQVGEREKNPSTKKLFCDKHPDGTDAPCRACATIREHNAMEQEREKAARAARAEKVRLARVACDICDDNGLRETPLGLKRCTHDPATFDDEPF